MPAWLPLHGNTIGSDRLAAGASLSPGQVIVSPDGHFELAFQTDGNLVIYNRDPAARDHDLWASRTNNCPGGRATMQTDGNLVVYGGAGNTCWASKSTGKGGSVVVMQNDGNLVIYTAGGSAVWNSGTYGGKRPTTTPNIIAAITHAVSEIPVVGDIAKIVGETYAAPFNIAKSIVTGERLDHAFGDALKAQLKIIKDEAPYAQTLVSFVPGIGTGVAGAIGMGAALAEGKNLDQAMVAAIKGALPGGALAGAAFDTATKIAGGENVGEAALESARNIIPSGAAQKAFDIGTAVATGQKIQTALASGLASIDPGQMQTILAAGQQAIASTPGLAAALQSVAPGAPQQGFTIAAGLLSHTGMSGKVLAQARGQLAPAQQQGFDAALSTQPTAWFQNVTRPTLVAATQRPVAPTTAPTGAYAPYPKTGVGALGGPPAYAAYPSGMLGAPPPHGRHSGGGHEHGGDYGHDRGQTRPMPGQWGPWWGVPWSPESASADVACRAWGRAIEMPPAMQRAARAALGASSGRPTMVRGPDNAIYLFSFEGGTLTARPCAAVA